MHQPLLTLHVSLDAAAYASWFDSPLGQHVWADEQHAMLGVLRPRAEWRMLDAGCGDGRFAASLAKCVATVVGIDASAEMLRAAANRTSRGGFASHLARADLAALPFAPDTFDAVTAVTVLCFMPDPVAALKELARVVRPGGRVVVGELGRWSAWALQRRLAAHRHGGLWSSARFWSKRTLSAALMAAGLIPRDVRAAVFYSRVGIRRFRRVRYVNVGDRPRR